MSLVLLLMCPLYFSFYIAFDICKMFSIYFYVGESKNLYIVFLFCFVVSEHKGRASDSECYLCFDQDKLRDSKTDRKRERNDNASSCFVALAHLLTQLSRKNLATAEGWEH